MAVCVAAADQGLYQAVQQSGKTVADSVTKFNDANTGQMKELNGHVDTVAQRMCAWAAPEYGGTGEGWDRKAMLAAQVAIYASIIALNTYVQNQNYKIAKAYSNLAQDRWTRFRDAYATLEKKMLAETSNTPEPVVPYDDAKTRAINASSFAFGSAKSTLVDYAKKYALCIDDTLDFSRSHALMRDDNINFNYRDAENFTEYKSDKRWNRRSDILNLGRSNLPTAYSYAQHASRAFGDLAGAIAGVGNGISGLLGYMFNRNETIYPAQFSQASIYGNGAIFAGAGGSTTVGF